MSIIEKIKSDILTAKKAKESVKATLLVTLFSEASNVGKNAGNRQTTDEETVAVIKKFKNNATETLTHLEKSGMDASVVKQEIEILDSYLPEQYNESKLTEIINGYISAHAEKTPKLMGAIMASLKKDHAGKYDAGLASKIVKSALS